MSSIRRNKRKSPVWFLDLRVNGKRVQKSLGTADKTEARIRARLMERELAGKPAAFHRITLEEFVREYLLWSATQKAPATVRNERYILERLKKETAIRYCDELSARTADLFLAAISQASAKSVERNKKDPNKKIVPMSSHGVSWYLRALRTIFGVALRWGYVTENHFRGVHIRKPERLPPRVLKFSEIEKLLKTVGERAPNLLDLFRFYLLTGVRRSEALALRWDDVNFDERFIIIQSTKGAKRFRTVPMFRYTLVGDVEQILRSRRHLPQPFAFRADFITHQAIKLARRAGLPDVSLHDLRRTCGTYLSAAGYSDFFVQQILGHEDRDTSRRNYIYMLEEMARKKQNIFEEASKN